ncbi:hypothetical protein SAMN05216548_1144 [Faunimonas pinastri]|uniref:Uncharacterized protein n=1 Tax=Faunimonas pinastri TaxID=1855383 RepID=A0A1H9MQY9_9HYPH|nr:hypothetical protein [Faunimonas pinastri]SER25835.1 hypothetical protein SAMN05216548_1144 [Faunimonas pinastri]
MTDSVKYLDLDAIDLTENEFVVKLGGVEHHLKPVTVEDFVENTKLIQSLGVSGKLEDEVDTVIQMLVRAFPTMTVEQLKKLELVKLNALLDFAHKNNGQKQGEASAEAEATANPPAAGQ